jgi:antirestriction protein
MENLTIHTENSQITPQIYVACLSSYNQGILHGSWIDADQEAEDIHSEIQNMLGKSPADGPNEEWAIHNHVGFGVSLSEYASIENVTELAQFICEFGQPLASKAYEHCDFNLKAARKMIEENYQGTFSSIEEWAEELLDSTGELQAIPEHLRPYFDFSSYARDLELNSEIFIIEDTHQVHVFWNN